MRTVCEDEEEQGATCLQRKREHESIIPMYVLRIVTRVVAEVSFKRMYLILSGLLKNLQSWRYKQ